MLVFVQLLTTSQPLSRIAPLVIRVAGPSPLSTVRVQPDDARRGDSNERTQRCGAPLPRTTGSVVNETWLTNNIQNSQNSQQHGATVSHLVSLRPPKKSRATFSKDR